MQLHLPYIFWDSFQYAFAGFEIIGIIYLMQLHFWRFSELILHKFFGGGYVKVWPNNIVISRSQTPKCPLNRLNAILSLPHPLHRYKTPSAIGNAIGRPLFRPRIHAQIGSLNHHILNRSGGSTVR